MQFIPGLNPTIPIRNIFCIGRNYAAHAQELGNPIPIEAPVVFLKPTSSICIPPQQSIVLSPTMTRVDHEIELVVAIQEKCKNTPEMEVHSKILGFGLGLDLTERTLQEHAKKMGQPWTLAKGQDTFCVLGSFVSAHPIVGAKNYESGFSFELWVNQVLKQRGETQHMLFAISKLIAYLSQFFTLDAGDLIFTGTPAGVGPLHPRDHCEGRLYWKQTLLTQFNVNVERG